MVARRIVLTLSIMLSFVLIYNLIWGKSGAISYTELKERSKVLEERIARIGEQNIELSREIRLLQSDAKYIEKMIRNRLNFVRNDEILYVFPGEAAGDTSGDPAR